MLYRFGAFELDIAAGELRAGGVAVALEPQVYALLVLLVENRDRLVAKDEIVEKVWDGRVVSDSALTSRVKSLRRALGDDGRSQRWVRTLHRRGYRFVAAVGVERRGLAISASDLAAAGSGERGVAQPPSAERRSRPSIAVLPFAWLGTRHSLRTLADALPHELIAALARLHWLFVTARASSFRLRDTSAVDVGKLLGVRYCLDGTVDVTGRRLVVTAELVDAVDGGVVWGERFTGVIDDVHAVREELCSRVVIALELGIPAHEATRARRVAVPDLDAWSAFHLALQHIYRFNRVDNAAAAALFQRAVQLDPGFARAHAGLSFVHFQTAFMRHSDDLTGETAAARRCAERAVELDPLDPFVNFTMGRTFWLEGDLDASLGWLEKSTLISPNFAQGIYARAWAEALGGRTAEARRHVDLAMRLSPLDPLHYAMLGTRAFTHMATGEDAAAAAWAERAARSPGAHVLIAMIAAVAHALAGDGPRARSWAANVRERNPVLGRDDFFRAFPMTAQDVRGRIARALGELGF